MRLDLHVHTTASDGYMSPKDAVDGAIEKGLDGIAVADHDTMEGYRRCKRYMEEKDFLLIPGIEVSTDGGHVLVLGNEDWTETRKFDEVVRKAKSIGALTVGAHPFSRTRKWIKPALLRKLDAVETMNGRTYMRYNRKAKEFAGREGMPQIGGSDGHHLEEIGTFWTETGGGDVKGVLENIRRGDCRAMGSARPVISLTKTKIKDAIMERI